MKDPKLTPEKIKQATEKAEKGRIIPTDWIIKALENAQRIKDFKSVKEKLSDKDRKELQKKVKEKKK